MSIDVDSERTARAVEVGRLIDDRLRSLSPAERDELMQQYIAQAMTPSERFRATGRLIQLGCQLRAARESRRDDR